MVALNSIMLLLNTSDFICTICSVGFPPTSHGILFDANRVFHVPKLFARDTTSLAALNITEMTSAFRE